MTRVVNISAEAASNLDDIHKYLVRRGLNDDVIRWLHGLDAAIQQLAELGSACPLAPESIAFDVPIHQRLYGTRHHRYRILFCVTRESIEVLHVRHGARASFARDELGPIPFGAM